MSLEEYRRLPKHPVRLVLDRLRSAFNVGSIFRTAETARLAEVITCGYTPHPPNPKLQKTALGALDYVPWRHFENAAEAVAALRSEGVVVFALETTTGSETYTDIAFPRPVALVLGNEAAGVDPAVIAACERVVEIPMFGFKNSMNVASACSVVVFEILRQWGARPTPRAGPTDAGATS
jgi:tRNA G18 (ribose-2'-O)-methylase SpoU